MRSASACWPWLRTPHPLTAACRALPTTLLHGDLATVNMAFEPDRPGCLTLIDWGLATAGPAELDIGRLLPGCAHLFGSAEHSTTSSPCSARSRGRRTTTPPCGWVCWPGIAWLGWNKALDIVEHPDPAVRERERAALPWWLHQAELASRDRPHLRGRREVDVNTLYQRTVEFFTDRVDAVREDQWGEPTPCTEWTVRDLANHVTTRTSGRSR